MYSRNSGAMWWTENDTDAVTRSRPLGFSADALTADSASLISASTFLQLR